MENMAPSSSPDSYEAQRARRIAENSRILQSLQLEPLAAPPPAAPAKRPAPAKKRRAEEPPAEPEPRRVSLRKLKLDPDGSEAKAVAEREEAKRLEELEKMRRVPGKIELKDFYLPEEDAEAELGALSALLGAASVDGETQAPKAPAHAPKLVMRDGNRQRATKDRIYSMAMHPYTAENRVLAVAGDKQGEVALAWCPLDPEPQAEDGTGGRLQQIWTFKLHKRPVTNLEIAPGRPQSVYTSSYEGSIRRTELATLASDELYGNDGELITTFSTSPSGDLVYYGTTEGTVSLIDLRADNKPVTEYAPLFARKICGMQLHPTEPHYLAAGSLTRTFSVFDVRKLPSSRSSKEPEAVFEFTHGYAVSSCYWSPDGTRMASTSFDDTVGLFEWKSSTMKKITQIKHDNQTGRWVTNFKARFLSPSSHLCVGGMKQTLDMYSAADGATVGSFRSEDVTAIPAVVAPSPSLAYVVATGNASGRIEIWSEAA
ncbi:WD40-repeat-containing domain protein [Hyaloraphidium curvatum]|nr:WD40-repeat-containing domain protein [Hyaloraphidium curvatum]